MRLAIHSARPAAASLRSTLGLQALTKPAPTSPTSPSSVHSSPRGAVTMAATAPRTALAETAANGSFVRRPSVWRSTIEKGGRFEPEGTLALIPLDV